MNETIDELNNTLPIDKIKSDEDIEYANLEDEIK
jgi:hypothetical protein